MRFRFNTQILTALIFIESILITLIAFGTFDILYILITVIVSTGFIYILGQIYEVYDFRLPVVQDYPDNKGFLILDRQKVIILIFMLVRILIVVIFVFVLSIVYEFNYLVIVIILDLLDILDSQMIKMNSNMVWRIIDEGTDVIVKFIFAWEFLFILEYYWVSILLIANIMIVIFMNFDLDFQYLKAFIPNVMYMISVYNTIWVYPLGLVTFFYYLFYYVFYYHTPKRV